MSRYFPDSDYFDEWVGVVEENNETHISSECEDDDYESVAYEEEKTDNDDDAHVSAPEKWAHVFIGDTCIHVSDHGKVKDPLHGHTTDGYAKIGTPYRIVMVPMNKDNDECVEWYVHDLVWRAFMGDPPTGYEVRHNFWVPQEGHRFYPNSLGSLDIYKKSCV